MGTFEFLEKYDKLVGIACDAGGGGGGGGHTSKIRGKFILQKGTQFHYATPS